jgi:SAM-dependent methyltransferase
MKTSPDDLIGLYERHAREFDRDRSRLLQEKAWLDGFLACVRPSGTVLDLGCGMGEPIARYIIDAGFRVVGVDSSPSLIDLGRRRFPDSEWLVADMRDLALGRRFDGILAWDSFFHLRVEEQRAMFERYGPPRSESSAVTLRFSRQLAVLIGVATPLLETIRHGPSCTRFRSGGRPSWMTSSSARFSCTACGAPRATFLRAGRFWPPHGPSCAGWPTVASFSSWRNWPNRIRQAFHPLWSWQ